MGGIGLTGGRSLPAEGRPKRKAVNREEFGGFRVKKARVDDDIFFKNDLFLLSP